MGSEVLLGNLFLVLYVFAWFCALKWQKKYTNNSNGPSKFFVYLYFSLSIITVILYNMDVYKYFWTEQITFFPLVYLFTMVMIAGFPIFKYDHSNIKAIQKPSSNFVNAFITIYILSIVLYLPNAMSKAQEGLAVIMLGGGDELYKSMEERFMTDSGVTSSVLVSLLSVFHNAFSEIGIMVFYYYLALKERKKWIVLILLANIFTEVVLPFAGGGRTNGTMIILNLVIGYFFFRDYLGKEMLSVFRKISVAFLILVSIPFIALTASRWASKSTGATAVDGLIQYTGEAPLFFDMYVLDAGGIRNGDRTCNLFKKWLGYEVPENFREAREQYSEMKFNDMHFSTFIGDFVLDYGPALTVIMVVTFALLCTYITRPRGKIMPFHRLILLYYIACVCVQGSFYLFFYSYHLGWKIVGFVLSYIIFYYDYTNNKSNIAYILKKND